MENIQGFSRPETIEYLRAYKQQTDFEFGYYGICSFIMMRYISRRTKILTNAEKSELQKHIWQFIAYWYDKLGYGVPIDANRFTLLFPEVSSLPLSRKVEERRIFIDQVLTKICNLILPDTNQRQFIRK